ncbi:Uu.00g036100.m01.CDS01 [Anthostomella pinea]|uniref:Uu.00g036100.m01.CDS01 n=1 Tax=Anthostomella pinea TaxID=933095 RepID=A0AAI8VA02_9PEZI|nr:Uu.00g036100.m01.CDS01 [Anthostomella pinea]
MVQRDDIRDIDLSLRFKHGKHTVFLFVDPMQPFSNLQQELLDILKERYPDGLTTAVEPPKQTQVPDDPSRIIFATPKTPLDLSQGWKPLDVGEDDTPVSKGLKNGGIVAFAIRSEEADEDEDVAFEVEVPVYDEEEYVEEQ